VFVVICGGLRWRRWWLDPVALLFFFFFPVQKCQSLCLLLLFFLLFSFFWFSPLYPCSSPLFFLSIPLFCFLYFFSFSLCFLHFSIFLFFLSIPYIYRQKTGGERPTTPVQSWHRGGVVGAALCSHPRTARGAHSLCFSPRGRPRVRV